MDRQTTFADIEDASRRRATKREAFLAAMDEANGLAEEILGRVNAVLEAKGVMMRGGSIVDATFIEAPSSTKNASGSRDPEMHQGRKGKNWHFGMKAHIGVGAGSGLVHTAAFTPANASNVSMAHALVREDDGFCYADSGYTGVSKRPEVAGDDSISGIDWVVAEKPSRIKRMEGLAFEHDIEGRKASVRAKVGHPFLIVKNGTPIARRTPGWCPPWRDSPSGRAACGR